MVAVLLAFLPTGEITLDHTLRLPQKMAILWPLAVVSANANDLHQSVHKSYSISSFLHVTKRCHLYEHRLE